jgi:hypothetical protein
MIKKKYLIKASRFYLTGEIDGEYNDEKCFEALLKACKESPKEVVYHLAAETYLEWWAETIMDEIESLAAEFQELAESKPLYYLVHANSVESDDLIPSNPQFNKEKFKSTAEEQGLVYQYSFQNAFNNNEFNTENFFIYIEN